MINKQKYAFNSYSLTYPKMFSIEKSRIKRVFPKIDIQHIGSTSVKILGGKGIIDIGIFVPKEEINKSIEKLSLIGYEYLPFKKDNKRKFLQRIIKRQKKERRIHVQLIAKDSLDQKAVLAVRNYLRKNISARKEYALIKKRAVKYAKGDGKKYREFKKNFLDNLEKQAIKDYNKINA